MGYIDDQVLLIMVVGVHAVRVKKDEMLKYEINFYECTVFWLYNKIIYKRQKYNEQKFHYYFFI